jgi:protein SCO1
MRADIHYLLAAGLAACLGAAACSKPAANERSYTLQGQVYSVSADHTTAMIKGEEIKGFMTAMTMQYHVKDPKLLGNIAPGDLINAKLVVEPNDAYLSEVKKVGQAPLAPASAGTGSMLSPPADALKPGDPVPDARFVNQDGKKVSFSTLKGAPVVLTFIYTRCPLPTFCPLMDRHFADIQQTLESDPALKTVHLVSITFDPMTDTPAVLKTHARELKADPARWTFLTGDRDEIDKFGGKFGLSVSRSPTDPLDITHNLRTAIVDADGKLVKVYTGNDWTPAQVLADLKPVAHGA